ncbi:MAG TPA: histidine kinase [Burkholderiaceae bacterium]|nr:histidine kinase [Burkholderiaceae bacterium]
MSDFSSTARDVWKRASSDAVRLFHEYANWLVSISWRRFFLFALLLIICAAILQKLPPFRATTDEQNFSWSDFPDIPPVPPAPKIPKIRIEGPRDSASGASKNDDVVISIDKNGVRITPRAAASVASSPAASAAADAASAAAASASITAAAASGADGSGSSIQITLPGATREVIHEVARAARQAADEARQQAAEARAEAQRDAQQAIEEARQEADEARREAQQEVEQARRNAEQARALAKRFKRKSNSDNDEPLVGFAFLWIFASALLKVTYKGRVQAEVKAAEATETAESEQLKRQVVEARMAAMQAQVEPHFLFNTLASIDHLIETDPKRASQMQKNLIALLRASMPTMRENHPAAHNLGREMAVIRPYLEILKVRMEDRLQTELLVPDGLLSADFPSMMIQSLVENAIKHGLEPKAEGGRLTVKAEIVHGKLAVTVADTGLGFGRAATAGTGVGLNNIRERLQLLYGNRASMTVAENQPSGTVVTLTVPYLAQPREGDSA